MRDKDSGPDMVEDRESFPLEPQYHPINRLARTIYDKLASARLAIVLLIVILACCICGVTLFREQQAMDKIFGTLWFNGLLVLLVVNTACCFFGRMWRRKITVVSFGMILFHLSFVTMFLAIVFNSLFSFNGVLRLTEGETLSNRDPKSYDSAKRGLLFSYSRLKGETSLHSVHRGFKVDGNDKLIAYDISLADGPSRKSGTIYINNKFVYKGIDYIRDKEGYSLLTIVSDRQGAELYGTHVPLQSYRQKDGTFIYGTGTMEGAGAFDFPPENVKALFGLQLEYLTDNQADRNGRVRFRVWPLAKRQAAADGSTQAPPVHGAGMHPANPMPGIPEHGTAAGAGGHGGGMMPGGAAHMTDGKMPAGKPTAEATVNVKEKFAFGEYQLLVPEVRYWVAMNVCYNPGKPFVLASLCAGLIGIIITTVGRMMRSRS